MAIPFLNNINLDDNQLQNAKLHVTSSTPTAAAGQIYFDSTADPGGNPPTYVQTAKYYSNATDTWVSLKEYSFPAGTYITGAVTGTTPKPIITFDLNAVDGTAAAGERYLTKSNTWAEISTIPGTYQFTLSDSADPAVTGTIASGDTVKIAATADLTSNLTTNPSTTKVITLGLKVDGGTGNANNYVLNQVTEIATADDTIPFNDYTPGATPPSTQTNIVKKTTFGTIPVDALTLVKQYIDDSVAGGLIYQGGYNADTNIPDLDGPPNPNNIKQGWTYTVTNDGLFFTEQVRVGDVLIAEIDTPTTLDDWTTVQNNVDLASLTQVGIGNVNEAGAGNKDGLSVLYASGTATVGLDITGLLNLSVPIADADLASLEIPLYNGDTSEANEKIEVSALLSAASRKISYAVTITDTATINHGLETKDVIIQLYDTETNETVYADVVRVNTAPYNTATITFASTPDNSVRVLVQKIG